MYKSIPYNAKLWWEGNFGEFGKLQVNRQSFAPPNYPIEFTKSAIISLHQQMLRCWLYLKKDKRVVASQSFSSGHLYVCILKENTLLENRCETMNSSQGTYVSAALPQK